MCRLCSDYVVTCEECTWLDKPYKDFYFESEACEHLILKYGTNNLYTIRNILWEEDE